MVSPRSSSCQTSGAFLIKKDLACGRQSIELITEALTYVPGWRSPAWLSDTNTKRSWGTSGWLSWSRCSDTSL